MKISGALIFPVSYSKVLVPAKNFVGSVSSFVGTGGDKEKRPFLVKVSGFLRVVEVSGGALDRDFVAVQRLALAARCREVEEQY